MKLLRVSCIAVAVLFAIVLCPIAISFADNVTTQDDIKSFRDIAASIQQTNPEAAKKLNDYADKVATTQTQAVPQVQAPAPVQQPAPKVTKYIPSPSSTLAQAKDFWLIDSPKDWPSQVMGGLRGGTEKMKTYSDNLIPFLGTKDAMLFADVKSVFEATNTDEENFGVGARALLFDDKLLLGGNFFYDTKYDKLYDVRNNQLAFGLEGLSKWVDLRTNFYFPISDKKYIPSLTTYSFGSTSLLANNSYVEPLTGLDYEGGVLIPYLSDYLETRAFIGGYNYFPSEGKGLNGIKGRIEIRPVKALTINLELKKDNYNPTEFFVEGVVTVPLDTMNVFKITNPLEYLKNHLSYKKGIRPLRERMVDRIVRDIDITMTPKPQVTQSKVHDLTYVDNSYGGTSTGTKEQPYKTIQTGNDGAVGDGWVYVEGASHTSYAESITLTNSVTLWGSGYNGGFRGLTTSGVYPIIDGTSTSAYGITLGNNNTVMGMQVIGTTTAAIYSTTAHTATISHNIITGNTGDGIGLFPSSGNLTATITDNIITNNTEYGIDLITTGGGTVTATLANNTEAGNNGDGYISDGVTTTDLGTGLVWAADGNYAGCDNGGKLNWANAISYYESPFTFAGYSDWRLPTVTELTSIMNYNSFNPAIYAKAFPNTKSNLYWSSTGYAYNLGRARGGDFNDGNMQYIDKSYANYVRGVRGS